LVQATKFWGRHWSYAQTYKHRLMRVSKKRELEVGLRASTVARAATTVSLCKVRLTAERPTENSRRT